MDVNSFDAQSFTSAVDKRQIKPRIVCDERQISCKFQEFRQCLRKALASLTVSSEIPVSSVDVRAGNRLVRIDIGLEFLQHLAIAALLPQFPSSLSVGLRPVVSLSKQTKVSFNGAYFALDNGNVAGIIDIIRLNAVQNFQINAISLNGVMASGNACATPWSVIAMAVCPHSFALASEILS